MKSRTAFFNFALLKKDITRFVPVWGLYFLFLMLRLDANLTIYQQLVYPLMGYAILCAITLFGDLYTPRRCNALHAMPIRREGWLLTHGLAGFLFFFVPTTVFFLSLAVRSPQFATPYLVALCSSSALFLLYFSIALLSAMLAGNRIGAVVIYGVICFFSNMLRGLYLILFSRYLDLPQKLSRVLQMLSPGQYLPYYLPHYAYGYDNSWQPPMVDYTTIVFYGYWRYLWILLGVSLLLAGLALLLYRVRKLERAGDFTVFKWLGDCFPPLVSLMVGIFLFEIGDHPREAFLFLMAYMAIGYFAGRMIQLRRFRVFQLKAILIFAGLVIVVLGSMWLAKVNYYNGLSRSILY